MSQEQLLQARKLIKEKHYDEAREILYFMDNPTAKKWIEKLEEIDSPFTESPAQSAPTTQFVDPYADGSSEINAKNLFGALPKIIFIGIVALLIYGKTGFSFPLITSVLGLIVIWILYRFFVDSVSSSVVRRMREEKERGQS